MDKITVASIGIGLIAFIYWFFFGKKTGSSIAQATNGLIDVLVEGGYKPSIIKVKNNIKTTLSITRKDDNSCLEDIVLPDFKISKYLPVNEKVEIEITPTKAGEYPFHCGMNMYHGKIIVE